MEHVLIRVSVNNVVFVWFAESILGTTFLKTGKCEADHCQCKHDSDATAEHVCGLAILLYVSL